MNNKSNLTMLHLLLVLTYIWSSLNLFSYLSAALMLPSFKEVYESSPDMFPEQWKTMTDMFLSLPRGFFAVGALLYAVELAGGVLMWRLRRIGFHCYTVARLLLLLVPLLFIGRDAFPVGDAMFALLFIVSYYMLLKSLGAFGDQPPTPPTTQNS